MSTQLEQQGITLIEGYEPEQLEPRPDLAVIGNVMRQAIPVWSMCLIIKSLTPPLNF